MTQLFSPETCGSRQSVHGVELRRVEGHGKTTSGSCCKQAGKASLVVQMSIERWNRDLKAWRRSRKQSLDICNGLVTKGLLANPPLPLLFSAGGECPLELAQICLICRRAVNMTEQVDLSHNLKKTKHSHEGPPGSPGHISLYHFSMGNFF